MGIGSHLIRGYQIGRLFGPWAAIQREIRIAHALTIGPPRSKTPTELPDQRDLIEEFLAGDEKTWIIWFDGGRYDWFEQLYSEYVEGELSKCWNGGVGYTGDWSVRNLSNHFPDKGLFSEPALRNLSGVDYDGREHFGVAPDIQTDAQNSVKNRLATLGYLELNSAPAEIDPLKTNEAVLNHRDSISGGVIRYLKPHPPFNGLEGITSGTGKITNTMDALLKGSLDIEELKQAYERTYRTAFEAAIEIIPQLDGRVVITADHGECIECGQLFHSRNFSKHDHLVNVPWLEVNK